MDALGNKQVYALAHDRVLASGNGNTIPIGALEGETLILLVANLVSDTGEITLSIESNEGAGWVALPGLTFTGESVKQQIPYPADKLSAQLRAVWLVGEDEIFDVAAVLIGRLKYGAAASTPIGVTDTTPNVSNFVKVVTFGDWLPAGLIGAVYTGAVLAVGDTAGAITFALAEGSDPLPTGLSMASTGVITGTPSEAGDFEITVEATQGEETDSADLTLRVEDNVVTIYGDQLPPGTIDAVYTGAVHAVGEKQSAITFALTQGSNPLPTGLVLGATGAITGTPTEAGDFEIEVIATQGGQTDTKTLTLRVEDYPPIVLLCSELPNAIPGSPYEAILETAGGSGEVVFTMHGQSVLPAGLELSTAGIISGTPTAAGSTFQIDATDDSGTATQSFDIPFIALTQNVTTLYAGTVTLTEDVGVPGNGSGLHLTSALGRVKFICSHETDGVATATAKLQESNDNGVEDTYTDVTSGAFTMGSVYPAHSELLKARSTLKDWVRVYYDATGTGSGTAKLMVLAVETRLDVA